MAIAYGTMPRTQRPLPATGGDTPYRSALGVRATPGATTDTPYGATPGATAPAPTPANRTSARPMGVAYGTGAATTPAPAQAAASSSPYVFKGIGAGQSKTGLETQQYLESVWGKPLTAEQRLAAMQHIGYGDNTGASAITADNYNKLMQWAAGLTGGSYEAYAAPTGTTGPGPGQTDAPYPTEGPVYEQPFPQPAIAPAPEYTATPFVAPSREAMLADPGYRSMLEEGIGALDAAASSRGMDRTSRNHRGLVAYASDLADRSYAGVFDRAATAHGLNTGERQAEYASRLLPWQVGVDANQRAAELNFDRAHQRELYGRDDAYRRWRAAQDDSRYDRDAAWRQYVLEEERRRWLADKGYGAAGAI